MTEEPYVPTLSEIWDFLQEFKAATVAGFERVSKEMKTLETNLRSEIVKVRDDLQRIEGRVVRIEGMNIDRRLDDHERRITRLETRLPQP